MDLVQAQILTEMLVEPLKWSTQRLRPDGSNSLSFPSGHAAITFAAATVIERHLGWRKAILGYGIASYVAVSRLHDNRHWLSDVVFGAARGVDRRTDGGAPSCRLLGRHTRDDAGPWRGLTREAHGGLKAQAQRPSRRLQMGCLRTPGE